MPIPASQFLGGKPFKVVGADEFLGGKGFTVEGSPSINQQTSSANTAANKAPDYKSSTGGFIANEFLGAGPIQDRGLAGSIVQNTIGSRGVAGVAQLPGRVAAAQISSSVAETFANSAAELQKINDRLAQSYATAAPEKRNEINKQIKENAKTIDMLFKRANGEELQANDLSLEQVGGIALNAATTVGTGALGKAATFGGKVAQGAGIGAASGVGGAMAENKSAGDVLASGAIGGAVGAAIPVVTTLAKKIYQYTASKFSGVPVQAIERLAKNPDEISARISEFAKDDSAKLSIVKDAKSAIDKVAKARGEAYKEGLAAIQNDYVVGGGGKFVIGPDGETIRLTTKGIKDSLKTVLDDFDVAIDPKTKRAIFDTSVFTDKAEQTKINALIQKVYKWKDLTPEGIEKLRRIIGNSWSSGASNEFKRIVTSLKGATGNYLDTRIPEFGALRKSYALESDFIKQFTKELSVGKNVSVHTAFNKLTGLLKGNNPIRKQLIQQLGPVGEDLMDSIAATAFSDWLPRGLVAKLLEGTAVVGTGVGLATGNAATIPGAIAAATVSSPRIVGKTVETAARLSAAAQPLKGAIIGAATKATRTASGK